MARLGTNSNQGSAKTFRSVLAVCCFVVVGVVSITMIQVVLV